MATPFRLDRVLRLRGQMRRLRQHEADRLREDLDTTVRAAEETATARDRLGAVEAERARRGMLTGDGLAVGRAYDRALAAREASCRAHAVETRVALEVKRGEVVRERREERKYERLADAHRERTAEEEGRAEARNLDEIALLRYARAREELP